MTSLFKGIRWKHDIILIGNMAVLAACGLIYEYLLSHYAGRIIGAVETAIYAMIGIMIVSMGLGAFSAKWVKQPFRGFVFLELAIAMVGGMSILVMSMIIALAYETPAFLQSVYGVSDIRLDGGIVVIIKELSYYLPFISGFIIGFLIGMEIPLIARIRQSVYQQHLEHNTGTIYGADYIGAGFGALLWVVYGLKLPIMQAASYTATLNLLVGCIFLFVYRDKIKNWPVFAWFSLLILALLAVLMVRGDVWVQRNNSALFVDQVVYAKSTPYQQLTMTLQYVTSKHVTVLGLYINGGLQFSENDEHIYHQMLVTPVMLAAPRHEKVLLVGGGDGLALRDILRWQPKSVKVVDLDKGMTNIFSGKDLSVPLGLRDKIANMTQNSFADKRVTLINTDAFLYVDQLIDSGELYDVIIVDLPDPRHPSLNKLYSKYFYTKLKSLLAADGALVVQSTSPYHAKRAFVSIGKSVAAAGFITDQYHANVPSFGEWGWTIATKVGASPLARIKSSEKHIPDTYNWITKPMIESAFNFSKTFFNNTAAVEINYMGSNTVYRYHHDSWERNGGIYLREK